MNKMKEVAALLGVELGEEFKIKITESSFLFEDAYRISHGGLEYNGGGRWFPVGCIGKLLRGEYKIVKQPWKMKHGDTYWCVYNNTIRFYDFNIEDEFDLENYILGNCFRTREEAEANTDRILKKLKKMYDDGVQL